MLAFAAGAFILTTYACNFNLQRETENAVREHDVILTTISNRISDIGMLNPDISHNVERLNAIMQPLENYYLPQGVRLGLYYVPAATQNSNSGTLQGDDFVKIYSSLPEFDNKLMNLMSPENKNEMNARVNDTRYVFVASQFSNYPHLVLVYARDIGQIDDFRVQISQVLVLINVIVLVILGSIIFVLLRRMMRPITLMNSAAIEIANGAYEKRVTIDRDDELGTLARSFNRMADSVEDNIAHISRIAEERQQFIDDLSHEMRTPLTSILGYAEYLQQAKSTEEERILAAGHLLETAQRLNALSAKLLELTSFQGESIEFKNVSVLELFEATAAMMRLTLTERDIGLSASDEPVSIYGDETLLLSLLTNLIENAARASKPGDIIMMRAYSNNGTVIEIIDTGIGMSKEEIRRITAPFYRVDRSRSRKAGGAGLGMSIVSQIVSLHGAKLDIESELGIGTTVRISFTTSKHTPIRDETRGAHPVS